LRITDITPQKKRGRYNLLVDEKFFCGISDRTLARFGLYKGKEVERSDLEAIFKEEIVGRLYDRAVGKIARRPQSELEIQNYCRGILWKKKKEWFEKTPYEGAGKVLAAELVEEVIGKLSRDRLLSDKDFAKWWVEQRKNTGNRGWALIESELKVKGVDQEIINTLSMNTEDEAVIIRKAKAKYCRGVSAKKCRERLARRGFSWDAINSGVPWD
jgi:regulatory protein